tara:strand:- start:739 stop:2112 length:1374 start_codon:yes stop_codon:yes gene_type:complete
MKKFLPKILLIEDDPIVVEFFMTALKGKAQLFHSLTGEDYLSYLKKYAIDIIYTDLNLPNMSGHDVVLGASQYDDLIPIIVISSTEDINDSINAFRAGVIDFLPKPLQLEDILRTMEKGLKIKGINKTEKALPKIMGEFQKEMIVGNSKGIIGLKDDIKNLIGTEIDVLILGENGTGKELVAKTLFSQENQKKRPYITLNCSVIPKELIESVLFGHEKGSFTGAINKQIGKFELANGGDIFLDEIGTLSFDLQAKLLRVLQEREIEPIGLGQSKKLDFRVISATNEDLVTLVKEKIFRKDLYYRLKKIVLEVPPLRERKDDIPLLIDFFLEKHSRKNSIKKIHQDALEILIRYSWPGNIRELENTIENLVITCREDEIKKDHIKKLRFEDEFSEESAIANNDINIGENQNLDDTLKSVEKKLLQETLNNSSTKESAAQKLGINRKTLYKKIKLFGLG